MNRLTLRFSDAGAEALYAQQHARKAIRPVRIGLVFACVMTVAVYAAVTRVFHHVLPSTQASIALNLVLINGL